MFDSIPRCHDAESESDFYRLHINFCVLRSRKKKKKKIFLWQLWVIYCLSIVVVVVGIRAANRPVPPTSLSWTRLMYASPSHRCRGLDKNRRRRSQFMRVAPQSCHSCQLAIAIRGRRVGNERERVCEEQEKVLKLVAPTKSLPCTCVASSLSVPGPVPGGSSSSSSLSFEIMFRR